MSIKIPGAIKAQLIKIALPGLLGWLIKPQIDRVLHVPDASVDAAAAHATELLQVIDPTNTSVITPAIFRAVEATQKAILTDGIQAYTAK